MQIDALTNHALLSRDLSTPLASNDLLQGEGKTGNADLKRVTKTAENFEAVFLPNFDYLLFTHGKYYASPYRMQFCFIPWNFINILST